MGCVDLGSRPAWILGWIALGGELPRLVIATYSAYTDAAWFDRAQAGIPGITSIESSLQALGSSRVWSCQIGTGFKLFFSTHSAISARGEEVRWDFLGNVADQLSQFSVRSPNSSWVVRFLDAGKNVRNFSDETGYLRSKHLVCTQGEPDAGIRSCVLIELDHHQPMSTHLAATAAVVAPWVWQAFSGIVETSHPFTLTPPSTSRIRSASSNDLPAARVSSDDINRLRNLLPLEWDVLRGMCAGSTNVEIAQVLNRSTSTVRAATSRIYDTLGVRNRQAAVALAAEYILPAS